MSISSDHKVMQDAFQEYKEIINQIFTLSNAPESWQIKHMTFDELLAALYKLLMHFEDINLDIQCTVNTHDADATSEDILLNKTAYVQGKKITGSISSLETNSYMPTTTDIIISANQYLNGDQTIIGDSNLISKNIKNGISIFNVSGDENVVDTSDANATSEDIIINKTAYVKGNKITGSIALLESNTYTPTITDITIPSKQYINGDQIIKGDSNLLPENIKKDVSIFNVTGTFENKSICTVYGSIIDGITNTVITQNGNLIYRDLNIQTGDPIYKIATIEDGTYKMLLNQEDNFTVEVYTDGYIKEYFNINVAPDNTQQINYILSPELSTDEAARIITGWGSSPTDLDTHIIGEYTLNGVTQDVHIWYNNKSVSDFGSLDVDSTNGYGPETFTLKCKTSHWKYYIYNYSNSVNFLNGECYVSVYLDDGTQQIKYIANDPTNTKATWWCVYEYNNGSITFIDKYYASNGNNIGDEVII